MEDVWTLPPDQVVITESMLRQRLQHAPQDIGAMRALAVIEARHENYAEAERLLEECLQWSPMDNRACLDLVLVLYAQRKAAPMLPLLDRLTALDPDSIRYKSLQAAALSLLGQSGRAVEILVWLLTKFPSALDLWLSYGHTLRAAGQSEKAILAYQQAIQLNSACSEAWLSLADLKTFRFSASDVTKMREEVARCDLSDDTRLRFEFALGKALEDQGEFFASFTHYARANALRRGQINYDSERFSSLVRRTQELYRREFFNTRTGWGCQTQDPIFVVGVPRSGSTLIEQILASHSQVEGTGELPDITAFAVELWLRKDLGRRSSYPQPVGSLCRQEIDAFALRYLSRTQSQRTSGKSRFIDRMLGNFVHLGFIHLMFPRAAIIDVRRHPLACGFSCYKQLFGRGANFAYSLRELGRYYRDHATVMQHFDTVLPGRVHRVYYEELVAEPEAKIKDLLKYCGLSFEDECLRFYANDRVIHSISSEQVRRPIYKESMDHWRKYEPWLAPLKEEMGDLAIDYPH